MKYICPGYDLFLPSTAKTDEERLAAVMNKADNLLSTLSYLRGVPDEQVHINNSLLSLPDMEHRVKQVISLTRSSWIWCLTPFMAVHPNLSVSFPNSKTPSHTKLYSSLLEW